jgi:adenosylcobinamide-GDP ribazoletransferase
MLIMSEPVRESSMLKHAIRLLATALTFLTRLPFVARYAYPDAAAIAASASYWSLIGSLLGAAAAGVFALTSLAFPSSVAAWLTLLSIMVLTGAFHEDGLADSADALYGGYSVQRRLEIMKDSRIGTFGAVALITVLAVQAQALSALSQPTCFAALILAHALGRASSIPIALILPYVSLGEHNKPVAAGMRISGLLWNLLWLSGVALALLHLTWISVMQSALLAIALPILWGACAWHSRVKLGGITGDILGAINVLTQTLCYLVLLASSK